MGIKTQYDYWKEDHDRIMKEMSMAEKMKIENGSRSNHIIISGRDGGKTFTWLTTHFCDPGPRFQIVWSGVNTMEVAFDRDEDATMCRLMAQC